MSLEHSSEPIQIDEIIKEGLEIKAKSPHEFYIFCRQIKNMADGGQGGGQRRMVYPDWSDDDFREVLKAIQGYETLNEQTVPGKPRFYNEILDKLEKRQISRGSGYYETVPELIEMASGGNPSGLRDDYPGWSDDDFARLLGDLGEEDF